MDLKAVKELVAKYSIKELEKFADELENTGKTSCQEGQQKNNLESLMSDFLQSVEIKKLMDQGMPWNDAVREFTKRIRSVLT